MKRKLSKRYLITLPGNLGEKIEALAKDNNLPTALLIRYCVMKVFLEEEKLDIKKIFKKEQEDYKYTWRIDAEGRVHELSKKKLSKE